MTSLSTPKWKRPKSEAPVTKYRIRYKKVGGNWKKWQKKDPRPDLNGWIRRTYKELKPKTEYKVQVVAVSDVGKGDKKAIKVKTRKKS